MQKRMVVFLMAIFIIATICTLSVGAEDMMKTAIMDGLRIELHVLPAEPFFTAKKVKAKHVTEGMLIMGSAKPTRGRICLGIGRKNS